MKLHLIKSSFVCFRSISQPAPATQVLRGRPSGPIATGAALAQADMADFCRGQAATQYGAPPGNISTENPVPRIFGSLVVGTADTGVKTYIFNCRFDPSGNFLGISET